MAGEKEAWDAIAVAVGCPQWDYPGQLVRDVQTMAARLESAKSDRDALYGDRREALAIIVTMRADYARIAHAVGVEYVADHCPVVPGPVDAVVEHIEDAVRRSGELAEMECKLAEVTRERDDLAAKLAARRDAYEPEEAGE